MYNILITVSCPKCRVTSTARCSVNELPMSIKFHCTSCKQSSIISIKEMSIDKSTADLNFPNEYVIDLPNGIVEPVRGELSLTHHERYVLAVEFSKTIRHLKYLRDKVGFSPDDEEAEPNDHIKVLYEVAESLGVELFE